MMLFAARWPLLVDPATGTPRWWRHFAVAIPLMTTMDARAVLQTADAVNGANLIGAERERWVARQNLAAGLVSDD